MTELWGTSITWRPETRGWTGTGRGTLARPAGGRLPPRGGSSSERPYCPQSGFDTRAEGTQGHYWTETCSRMCLMLDSCPHHCPVGVHAAQLWDGVPGVDGHHHAGGRLVPVVATRHLLLVLHTHTHSRGHRTHTHGAATFLALQQWRPELQPRCSRKLLKSVVLMQQQLQNLYLMETMVPGYQLVGSLPTLADPVLTPRGRRGLLGDGCSSQRRSRDPGKPSRATNPINKPLASSTGL